ncbi:Calcium-dependent protein kinase [Thalictrum thalictroides]|uniref:non-specific serine/threonine protein kinase n=1 Tax=Thalictrum thalictroides TaxID=46969 RepID=A0A7J6WLQ6_THATH|nr:Calcium-dependent protein kinase [Thalictrum thalictroides]
MAVAQSNSNIRSSIGVLNCFRVVNLTETILDSDQVAHLEDQYQLGKQLGWGQFGIIRSCSDKFTGEVLACKSIAREKLVTAEDLRSVKLEIEIMARLSGHPNVVNLKAVYEDEDYVHLVMELCAGGELFHQLEKHGRFSESEARVLFKHLMLVVMYCHDNGVVHRDLKPENILLATKSSSSPIKLADFGLATYIKPGQSLHGTVGSPFYIAPEVLVGGYNQAADVWSAGVILYILLSGIPPFWGKTKSRIFDSVRAANLRFPTDPWDGISESAKDLITGMLCTDSTQRLTAAKVLGPANCCKGLQSLHGTVGSPFYIAPEVLVGGYNQAADVWSAGVIWYILLSGIPSFWGKTKSRIFDSVRAANLRFPTDPWDGISESAKDLITGMLCTDPTQRLTAAKVLGLCSAARD